MVRILGLAVLLTALAAPAASAEEGPNGFSLEGITVDAEKVLGGGPKRDGIRSVDAPTFTAAEEATWVAFDSQVIGVELGDEARAYPVHLLEYHQIVNDELGGRPIAITYDPIAGTPVVFDRKVGDRVLEFGVSGLIYESNFLLYDRETESLWSQLPGRAISGPLAGKALRRIPARQEAFAVWLGRHPATVVLDRPLPKRIDYRYSRFQDYWISPDIPFPVSHRDDTHHPKTGALGVVSGDKARVYLGPVLLEAGGRVVDEFDGHRIRVAYDPGASSFIWEVPDGVEVQDAYWFAWKNWHPDTEVWMPDAPAEAPAAEPSPDSGD